jgi:hypothetical protein
VYGIERLWWERRAGSLCALLLLLSGCATLDQQAGFSDVSTAVEKRSGKRVAWNLGTELDAEAAEDVRRLLAGTLTADAAIQLALLNNRGLQAMYAELGVGQTRTIEFIADAPGDWAFHCHMTHHVMNQMGHEFPNMVGVKPGDLDERVRPLLPGYMTMGHTGMDMGRMAEEPSR